MTLGVGVSFNHYCLATPIDPNSNIPSPAYERPHPPRPAPAVTPGEKIVLNELEKERLRIYGNAVTKGPPDQEACFLSRLGNQSDDDDDVVQTTESFPGMISSLHQDATIDSNRMHLNRAGSLKEEEVNVVVGMKHDSAHYENELPSFSSRLRKMTEYQNYKFCDNCQIEEENHVKTDFYHKLQCLKLENRKYLKQLALYYESSNNNLSSGNVASMEAGSAVTQKYVPIGAYDTSETDNVDPEFVLEMHASDCEDATLNQGADDNLTIRSNFYSTTSNKEMSSLFQEGRLYRESENIDSSNQILWKRKMVRAFDGIESDSDEELFESQEEPKERSYKKRTRAKSAPIKRQKKEFVPTVPEPFNMTIREDEKRKEKRILNEMVETDLDDELSKNSDATSRIFKAKAVPKHVTQPIFQNMIINQPQRYAVGPISRMKRIKSEENISNNFTAKPFPSAIFTEFAYEKMKEDIAYRNVRKAIRQKELLTSSSLPPRMQSILTKHSSDIKKEIKTQSQNEKTNSKKTPIKAFRGQIKGKSVPNFDRLYQEFKNNMDKNKSSKLTTVPETFSFYDVSVRQWQQNRKNIGNRPRSANPDNDNAPFSSVSNKSKLIPEKGKEEQKRYSSNPNLSSSYTASRLNATCNTTSLLRAQQSKQRLEYEISNMKAEERKRMEAELKKREMRMMNPAWCGLRGKADTLPDEKRMERLKNAQELQREYQMDLDRIHLKVMKQPTLFQRQSRLNAKQNAEKKYQEVLKKEGLTEDEVTKSYEIKKERRLSKSTISEYSWVPKPCPVTSIKSAVKSSLECNTISQLIDGDGSVLGLRSLPSEDGFYE